MTTDTPSPDQAASIEILAQPTAPVDLIARKGGLFIPFEKLTPDDAAKLMAHLATYDVEPVACGEVIGVIPTVPESDRKK